MLVAAMLLPMFASAQTVKIGLVDQQAILSLMPETKSAQTQIADISKKYEDEYAKLNEEMQRMYEQLQQMSEDEPAAIKERKTRDFQDKQQKIQQFLQTADQDIQKLQNELMAPIVTKIHTAVESVGKEGGYTIVLPLEQQLVLYYQEPCTDITPQVKAKLGLQ